MDLLSILLSITSALFLLGLCLTPPAPGQRNKVATSEDDLSPTAKKQRALVKKVKAVAQAPLKIPAPNEYSEYPTPPSTPRSTKSDDDESSSSPPAADSDMSSTGSSKSNKSATSSASRRIRALARRTSESLVTPPPRGYVNVIKAPTVAAAPTPAPEPSEKSETAE